MGSLGDQAFFYQQAGPSSAPIVVSASGLYLMLENGQEILDSTCGAAVSAIGHGNNRVKKAIVTQLDKVTYAHPGCFRNLPALELADFLVKTTGGKLSRACLVGSGSEAMEAAMKLAWSYHREVSPKSSRTHFIARSRSWHGCTLATLSLGDFKARREPYESLLHHNVSHISPCHPYRDLRAGENSEDYLARLKQELEDRFQQLGSDNVCAFVIEPVVGTALGCSAPIPGYLKAMKEVCHRHGALLIFDEVMCGMGRTGTLHAWEHEGVVPDIQAIGKGLGAGYGAISALLVHDRVISGLKAGSAYFEHAQTYQCDPLAAVAALEVQRIVQENKLIDNVRNIGPYFGQLLHERLGKHDHVGDVRGRGLFWCVEFVANKATKAPLDPGLNVARRLRIRGLEKGYDICLFSATGSIDGRMGDHVLLAPPFIITRLDAEEIVRRVGRVVDSVFAEIETP